MPVLVKTGYYFDGWNTQANGGGTNYAANDQISMASIITLYAKWTASSTVSTLSNLTLSTGTPTPAFASGTTSYAASEQTPPAPPTVTDSTATVTVNGTGITSGDASGSINLSIGSNTITVLVTAQDGGTTSTYTVTVTRAAPAPTVTGISPTNGPTAGGTSITITGTNFTGATAVKFGSTNATSFTVNSANQITATSPAGSAGVVDITVVTADGTSATSSSDQFTYIAAPIILDLSGDTLLYRIGSGAKFIDQRTPASVSDIGLSNFSGGKLTVSIISQNRTDADKLSIYNRGSGTNQIGISDNNVTYEGNPIGTFSGGSDSDLVVIFTTGFHVLWG